mgnify:CR=1 FL=1
MYHGPCAGQGCAVVQGVVSEKTLLLTHDAAAPQQRQEQILDRIWPGQFENESNVLEVYVRYLRTKLEAGREPRLIHTVRGVGYALREE